MYAVVTSKRTMQRCTHVRRGHFLIVPAVKWGCFSRAVSAGMIYVAVLERLSLLPRGPTVHLQPAFSPAGDESLQAGCLQSRAPTFQFLFFFFFLINTPTSDLLKVYICVGLEVVFKLSLNSSPGCPQRSGLPVTIHWWFDKLKR